MFRRKLIALDCHLVDSFDSQDETQFRNLILWLEDQKIRNYKIEDREWLRRMENNESWNKCFEKYLKDINCPYSNNQSNRNALIDWLLGFAVRLEYGDNVKMYKEKVNEVRNSEMEIVSQNPLDKINFEDTDFKQGVDALANLLNITRHPDHLLTLKAISKLIQEKLSVTAVKNYQENPPPKSQGIQIKLENVDLGFDTGDRALNNAAKVLRLLHVNEIRHLQTKINETIVDLQQISADPKTDDKLGKADVRNRFQKSQNGKNELNKKIQAETKKLLRQMPSRNRIDFMNVAQSRQVSKQKRRQFASPIRSSSMFGSLSYDQVDGPFTVDENSDIINSIRQRLDDADIDLTTQDGRDQIDREFRDMKVHLTLKRKLKKKVIDSSSGLRKRRTNVTVSLSSKYKSVSERVKLFLSSIDFWHGFLYRVTGIHGSGVASYFQFLQWLFYLNLPLSFLIFVFIMIPQWSWASANAVTYCDSRKSFKFSDLLTGDGPLQCSALFYGYYTNETINLIKNSYYSMPYAYFFTVWLCYVFCLAAVLYSSLRLYRKNYIESVNVDVLNDIYVGKIFCGWDYQIRSAKSSALKRSAFVKDLKEHLADEFKQILMTKNQKYLLYLRRFALLFVITAILVFASFLVYIISDVSNPFPNASSSDVIDVSSARNNLDSIAVLDDITLALTVTAINYIVPYFLSALVVFQNYSPRTELYVSLASDFLLKSTTLVTMFYFWSTAIQQQHAVPCWETTLGQQIYRLAIMDFLFFIVFSLTFDLLFKYIAVATKLKFLRPTFHIGRNTMHLAYVQALCWLGAFFSPMAYLINALKLFVSFYLKFFCATYGCQPTSKLWRATQARVVFFFVLCLFLVISLCCVAFANYNLLTSKDCGPLRQYDSDYDVMITLLSSLSLNDKPDSLLTVALAVVTSEGMIVSFLLALCVIVYWQRRRAHAWSMMVENMKEQLILESKDKQYLLQIMQKIIEYDLTIRRQNSKSTAKQQELTETVL